MYYTVGYVWLVEMCVAVVETGSADSAYDSVVEVAVGVDSAASVALAGVTGVAVVETVFPSELGVTSIDAGLAK